MLLDRRENGCGGGDCGGFREGDAFFFFFLLKLSSVGTETVEIRGILTQIFWGKFPPKKLYQHTFQILHVAIF